MGLWGTLAGLLIAVQGCQFQQKAWDAEARSQVASEARAVLEAYHAEICREGLLAEFAYLDSSADFHWQPPGSTIEIGYDSVTKAIRQNAMVIDSTCGHWLELNVDAVSWDSARYIGVIEIWTRMANAETSIASLNEEGLMVKRKEGWKLLSGRTELVAD